MGLKKRNKVSAEFSMSSLTDIIFLLLIFFMLTSTLVSPNALNLKLPSSSSQTVAPASIPVSITKRGEWYVDGEKTSSGRLESAVRSRLAKEGKSSRKDITITIVAERGVPIEYVVKVMDLAVKFRVNAILATDPAD
jgi:biopolymer transport protein ExbD